jgi:hypothetical protein
VVTRRRAFDDAADLRVDPAGDLGNHLPAAAPCSMGEMVAHRSRFQSEPELAAYMFGSAPYRSGSGRMLIFL